MDFFHCVRCAHWPMFQPENRIRYFFSGCGRLLCENCVHACSNKCMCSSDQCKLVEIKQQTGKDVRAFFMDPLSLLQESLRKPFQVLQFQANLQKNCIRIVGKLVESTKAMKNEINSLKSEKTHLQQVNEGLKQQVEMLKSKVNEMSQANASASFLGGSPRSMTSRSGQISNQNDPLNIFRDVTERPNAQVPPNAHLQPGMPTPLVSPFTGSSGSNRHSSFQNTSFVAPSMSPAPSHQNQNPLFSQISHNTGGYSQAFSITRCTSSPNSFGTPASSVSQLSGGLPIQSPFSRRNDQLHGIEDADGRTPAIIARLRNLRCRATPSANSPYGNNP